MPQTATPGVVEAGERCVLNDGSGAEAAALAQAGSRGLQEKPPLAGSSAKGGNGKPIGHG